MPNDAAAITAKHEWKFTLLEHTRHGSGKP
jgi:hypothetical protein